MCENTPCSPSALCTHLTFSRGFKTATKVKGGQRE